MSGDEARIPVLTRLGDQGVVCEGDSCLLPGDVVATGGAVPPPTTPPGQTLPVQLDTL